MREFECPDTSVTTGRGVIDAFLAAFGAYKGRGEKVVCRHLGIEKFGDEVEVFYPLHRFLAAMSELQEQFGAPFMRKVGTFIFEKAEFPPGIDTLEKGMELLDVAYYQNHRNVSPGQIGGYHWKQQSERSGVMGCDNPYPCAFDVGIIETITRKFQSGARVTHEQSECRHLGGNVCNYLVEW
ncbi:MAG: hypothetical protein ACXVEF_01925 [Polyangiales bacterium]